MPSFVSGTADSFCGLEMGVYFCLTVPLTSPESFMPIFSLQLRAEGPLPADPSVRAVLDQLQEQYPGVPFLALGQTVLWDEPTKAVWRALLDAFYPDAPLVAGVHDTDYFAKTAAHVGGDRTYVALPHDDGRTRDLWSAAGEMSSLFGSESVPTRAMYEAHGVPFDGLALAYPGGKDALYREQTTAWGWRGIVSTISHDVIAHDIPVLDIKDALLEQMDWAFAESVACLDNPAARAQAAETAATVRGWVMEFLETCSDNCRLSDLYQVLLPRFYTLLLGTPPAHFTATASTELFQFTPRTCHRLRFSLLAHFLNPRTRAAACDAYNRAVSGSGIYTLDGFDTGAVPFDVVVPGKGRGTLRLTSTSVVVETHPEATTLPGAPQTLSALAEQLEDAFGPDVILVGKAVTLVDMIGAEFLVVFHETASGYTDRTRLFNQRLAAAGMPLVLHPIVRLAYPTWDALAAVPATTVLRLPPHLAATFGVETISAPDFARRWRGVVEQQQAVLHTMQGLRKTRDLMHYLEREDPQCWCDRQAQYEAALGTLKGIAGHSETLADRINEHQQELALWRGERQTLEQRKGNDWRANVLPLREKLREGIMRGEDVRGLQRALDRQLALRATAFDEPLAVCHERIDATRLLLASFRRQRRALERGPEARAARAALDAITHEAQRTRLGLVHSAYLTIEGLQHTQLRPTAWWLPLVDPTGQWLRAIAAGTQARLEALV